MKEYSLIMPTSVWNAIRYALITLFLVPLAEKLWALAHSRRTAARLLRGYSVRLRQSKLAHFGLHQEVDESSRLSKLSSIVVVVLHITGTLLLEYGSASIEGYVSRDAVLSATPSFSGEMLADDAYFVDADFVLGKQYGSTECVDGEPRNLSDLGLYIGRMPAVKYFQCNSPVVPLRDRNAKEFRFNLLSPQNYMVMYDNGTARCYYGSMELFQPESLPCQSQLILHSRPMCLLENDFSYMLSKALAYSAIETLGWAQSVLNEKYQEVRVPLHSIVVLSRFRPKTIAEGETTWIRDGMPRESPPRLRNMNLDIHIKGLRKGCRHGYAVHVSHKSLLNGLRILHTSPLSLEWGRRLNNQGMRPLLLLTGNWINLGVISNMKEEYCAGISTSLVCIKRGNRRKNEVYVQDFIVGYNFSVQGVLDKRDALNLAVQILIEIFLPDRNLRLDKALSLKSIFQILESRKIYRELIRVAGKTKQGKRKVHYSNIATINGFGIAGIVILIGLSTLPVPILIYNGKGIAGDMESMYWRILLQENAVQIYQNIPEYAPPVLAKEMF